VVVSVGQRTSRSAPLGPAPTQQSLRGYMFPPMFWPLIGGFIAFVLVAIFLGWILDPSRRDGHR